MKNNNVLVVTTEKTKYKCKLCDRSYDYESGAARCVDRCKKKADCAKDGHAVNEYSLKPAMYNDSEETGIKQSCKCGFETIVLEFDHATSKKKLAAIFKILGGK